MARGQNIGSMVFNKPQLIALDALQPIINYLSQPDRATTLQLDRNVEELVELKLSDFDDEEKYKRYKLERKGINPDTMVGTLDVSGAIMYRKGSMGADCTELTSYEGLKLQTQDMIDEGVSSIVMIVDSSGGQAYGMFSATKHIQKITKQAGVKTTAYVDGSAYSAAYGLAVLADELIVNPQASVGSVGVVVALYNDSKMLDMAGVTRQFVFAGENKIPFDKTGEFTDSFIEDLQKSVDKTYGTFTKHIASNRGLSEKAVIDTQASTYDADEALVMGLVDKIMELEDFELEYGLKTPKSNYAGFNKMAADNSHNIKEESMSKEKEVTPKDAELLSDAPAKPTNEGSKNMSDEANAQLLELTKENKGLRAQLLDFSEKLKASDDKAVELNGVLKEKELAHRTEQRQAKLEESLGKDNEGIEALLKNTESLSDESFAIVAQSLSGSQVKAQEALEEQGGEGQESELQMTLADKMKQTAATMNASRKA